MKEELKKIILRQREYLKSGATLPVQTRLSHLQSLNDSIDKYIDEIYSALETDLGKSQFESYMCEVGMVKSEISYMKKHISKFSKEKRVLTPIAQAVSKSFIKPSPKGTVLIMSPWNYPFMLSLDPLVDAISSGNTVILKPSAYAPNVSEIIKKIVEESFPPELVFCVTGGREENKELLNEKFDHIFFTGSKEVGREVLKSASKHLTPVTLELGGKSPCIVDETADIKISARRIVFGKFLNCGQTCVAPDYILCHESVKEELKKAVIREIKRQFGSEPLKNKDYGKIINEKHFNRLSKLLGESSVIYGGKNDEGLLKIEPTLISSSWEDEIMKDEIFGPLLPLISYDDLDEEIEKINLRDHPLALYIFSKSKKNIKKVTERINFGGGCINDTIIHLATTNMGFGGVGESGMGAYHGKRGFDEFSHYKSIVDKKTFLDLPMRYQPYTKLNDKLVKLFLK